MEAYKLGEMEEIKDDEIRMVKDLIDSYEEVQS